jgi:hypothetical protein
LKAAIFLVFEYEGGLSQILLKFLLDWIGTMSGTPEFSTISRSASGVSHIATIATPPQDSSCRFLGLRRLFSSSATILLK